MMIWDLPNVKKIGKMSILCGCLFGLLWGCSSRLETTTMSGTAPLETQPLEPQIFKPQVTSSNDEAVTMHKPTAQPSTDIGIPAIDIPVEPPTLPIIPSYAPTSISAATGTVAEEATPRPSDIVEENLSVIPTPGEIDERVSEVLVQPEEPHDPIQLAKVVPAVPESIDEPLKPLEDVYFDYDRFSIRPDAVSTLEANAKLLVDKLPHAKIVIEGHCDERGTQSYNIVLGKRRAKAIKVFLEDLGVPSENLQIVSYGKERPFCTDQNQECWQENRRGHFFVQ